MLVVAYHLDLPEAHLVAGIAAKGVKVTAILDPSSPYQNILQENSISIIHQVIKSRFSLETVKMIRQIIREKNITHIHALSPRGLSNSVIALCASRYNKIRLSAYRGTVGHLSRFSLLSRITFLSKRLNKIICVSDAVKNYLLQLKVAPAKVTRVYKGHDSSWYDGISAADLKEEFNLPTNAVTVTCTANLRPVKGVDILIDCLPRLPENFYLILIGDPRGEDLKYKNSPYANRIIFTGFRKNVIDIVKGSDLFVMPSRAREGLPKALIEAIHSRVPVIGTAVGGIPELIIHDKTGIIVPPNHAEELSKQISWIMGGANKELRKSYVENACLHVAENFSIKGTIEQTFKELF